MGWMSDLLSPRVPVILQSEAPECGIACLAMVASYYGHRTDLSAMRMRLSPSLKGITLKNVAQIAESMGMTARGVQVPLEALGKLRLPAILHWDMNHFVVLTKVAGKRITVHDPARGSACCCWRKRRATSRAWRWSSRRARISSRRTSASGSSRG